MRMLRVARLDAHVAECCMHHTDIFVKFPRLARFGPQFLTYPYRRGAYKRGAYRRGACKRGAAGHIGHIH